MRLDEALQVAHLRHGIVVVRPRCVGGGHQAEGVREDRIDRAGPYEEEGIRERALEVFVEGVPPVPVEVGRLAHDHDTFRVLRDAELRAQARLAGGAGAGSGARGRMCGSERFGGEDEKKAEQRTERHLAHRLGETAKAPASGRSRDDGPTSTVYAIGSTTSAPAPASQNARSGARTSNGTVRVSPASRSTRPNAWSARPARRPPARARASGVPRSPRGRRSFGGSLPRLPRRARPGRAAGPATCGRRS